MSGATIVIPARLESSRLFGKLLLDCGGKSLIQHTIENAKRTGWRVVVATDSESIEIVARRFCETVRTPLCECGTDRVAYAARELHLAGPVVNVQGDEPELDVSRLLDLVAILDKFDIGTLVTRSDPSDLDNPSRVKVAVSSAGRAMWFSRHDWSPWRHIGVYAYRAAALHCFASAPPTTHERLESLEQLRAIDIGLTIGCLSAEAHASIDTFEDYAAFCRRVSESV